MESSKGTGLLRSWRRAPVPVAGGTPRQRSLRQCAAEAAEGSVEAFEAIYRTLAPAVANYLRLHGVSEVDSVTNEVFAQVHARLGSFEGTEDGFRSWVFTIAHHRMVDERRRASRRPPVDSDADLDDAGWIGDAEADALDALGVARVAALLGQLSPDQREVVLLRVVADLPVAEVARATGRTPGAVKALQHRAIASLRRQLDAVVVPR